MTENTINTININGTLIKKTGSLAYPTMSVYNIDPFLTVEIDISNNPYGITNNNKYGTINSSGVITIGSKEHTLANLLVNGKINTKDNKEAYIKEPLYSVIYRKYSNTSIFSNISKTTLKKVLSGTDVDNMYYDLIEMLKHPNYSKALCAALNRYGSDQGIHQESHIYLPYSYDDDDFVNSLDIWQSLYETPHTIFKTLSNNEKSYENQKVYFEPNIDIIKNNINLQLACRQFLAINCELSNSAIKEVVGKDGMSVEFDNNKYHMLNRYDEICTCYADLKKHLYSEEEYKKIKALYGGTGNITDSTIDNILSSRGNQINQKCYTNTSPRYYSPDDTDKESDSMNIQICVNNTSLEESQLYNEGNVDFSGTISCTQNAGTVSTSNNSSTPSNNVSNKTSDTINNKTSDTINNNTSSTTNSNDNTKTNTNSTDTQTNNNSNDNTKTNNNSNDNTKTNNNSNDNTNNQSSNNSSSSNNSNNNLQSNNSSQTSNESSNNNLLIYGGIGSSVSCVLCIIVIILILMKKK